MVFWTQRLLTRMPYSKSEVRSGSWWSQHPCSHRSQVGRGPRSGKWAFLLWRKESARFLKFQKQLSPCNVAWSAVHILGLGWSEGGEHLPGALNPRGGKRILSVLVRECEGGQNSTVESNESWSHFGSLYIHKFILLASGHECREGSWPLNSDSGILGPGVLHSLSDMITQQRWGAGVVTCILQIRKLRLQGVELFVQYHILGIDGIWTQAWQALCSEIYCEQVGRPKGLKVWTLHRDENVQIPSVVFQKCLNKVCLLLLAVGATHWPLSPLLQGWPAALVSDGHRLPRAWLQKNWLHFPEWCCLSLCVRMCACVCLCASVVYVCVYVC